MQCLISCSRVILLGDLNYRISLPEHKIRALVDKEEWNMLLENDQVASCLIYYINKKLRVLDLCRIGLILDCNWLEQYIHGNIKLKQEIREGQVFEGWHEGAINFAPTYKYNPNSDAYYGSDHGKKGEKKRAPAW